MKVFLFRHGEIDLKGEKRFIGQTDISLNSVGREQAEIWKRRFHNKPPAVIVSGPLSRTLVFAKTIASGGEVLIRPELSEINLGDWDGKPMKDIRTADPVSWRKRGEEIARFRPPGGESFLDVFYRVIPAFEEILRQDVREMIVVAHAGVNRVILCHLLGMPLDNLFRIGQDYACLNEIETLDSGGIRIRRINMPCPVKG